MTSHNLAIGELGLVRISIAKPHERTDLDTSLRADIDAARQPHLAALTADETLVTQLESALDRPVTQGSSVYGAYQGYLETELALGDDEQALSEFEQVTLQAYHTKRRQEVGQYSLLDTVVTNGVVAELATRSARRHKWAAREAGELVFSKHQMKANIATLEAHLPEADQVLFAPSAEFEIHPALTERDDEEAKSLKNRLAELQAIYKKRWAFTELTKMFSFDILERSNVVAVGEFIEGHAQDLSA